MNNVLYKKPEITPVATCSSHAGLVVAAQEDASDGDAEVKSIDGGESFSGSKRKYKSTFSKKRLAAANAVERRHKEKLMRQDKFLACFEEYLEILRNKGTEEIKN